MNFKSRLSTALLSATTLFNSYAAPKDDLNINARLDVVQDNQIFANDGYFVWGGSTIKGDDGKYHMFYARWNGGFGNWTHKSEICYAVSDSAFGPFKYVKTILNGSGDKDRWDYVNAHNPTIKKFGDTYYLYYIATQPPVGSETKYRVLIDHQSIGYIKAKSIEELVSGNTNKLAKPLLAPDNIKTFRRTVNPSVTKGPNNEYFMAFKSTAKRGGFVHWLAKAASPEGPFKIVGKMLDHHLGAEDPYLWYDFKRERFYAVVKEFGRGKLAPQHGALAMITSTDGQNWAPAKHSIVSLRKMNRPDKNNPDNPKGKLLNIGATDRPQMVFDENGEVIGLNVASDRLPGTKKTYNVQLRILPEGQEKNLQDEAIKKLLGEKAKKK